MNVSRPVYAVIVFTFLLVQAPGYAQRDGALSNPIGTTRQDQDSIPPGITPLDTLVPMTYVLMHDPGQVYSVSDTLTWSDVRHFPLRFDQAHLGNYGSAARTLTPDIRSQPIGFATGWTQYDPYYLHEETFRYYNQDIPASRIRHSQASQENTWLTLEFGRSFARGLHMSVVYNRINQIGEFANQRQKNTALGIGVWHHAPSGRYDAFYNFIANAAITQENGGVSAPDSIGVENFPDLSIPTFLTSGLTTHKYRRFVTKHIFHLLRDTSSLGIDIWAKVSTHGGLYKYTDSQAALASDYYGPDYLPDPRGIRQFTFQRDHQLSMGVALPWRAAHSTVQASLRYRNLKVDQEPVVSQINEVYFEADGQFQWIEPLKLNGRLSIGLGQAEGNFTFASHAVLQTGNIGQLRGEWSIISRQPFMIETGLFVSQLPVYNTDFANPLTNEVGVSWESVQLGFRAGVKWIVFDHYIYFDSAPVPRQINEAFSLRRFYVRQQFDLDWIGVQGHVIVQPGAREELAIPDVLYNGSLFGRLRLFKKKVTLMPGVEVTYHQGHSGISYFPVAGVWHLTDGPSIPDYFRVDAGVGMEIGFLKAYIRMDDIGGAIRPRALHQADFYPQYRGYLRLGIEAAFFN